jgi:nitrite reductase/ring-hydroxylating ferredoxin subunit
VVSGGWAISYDGDDPVIRRAVDRLGTDAGSEAAGCGGSPTRAPTTVVVVEVDDGAEAVADWHARCPDVAVVGVLRHPNADQWRAAERAGCDLVTTRGALGPALRRWRAAGGGFRQRLAVLDAADVAGRLGLVAAVEVPSLGPLALYRVDGRLCAVGDRCPHAGARLSAGALDGSTVTCPGHGSQFDVLSGERVRGPADRDVPTFRLTETDGRIFLEVPGVGS